MGLITPEDRKKKSADKAAKKKASLVVKKASPENKKSAKEEETELHLAEIHKLDQEMEQLEKKLGVHGDVKKKQQLKRRFAGDNFDEDLIDFLEGIDRKVKKDIGGDEDQGENDDDEEGKNKPEKEAGKEAEDAEEDKEEEGKKPEKEMGEEDEEEEESEGEMEDEGEEEHSPEEEAEGEVEDEEQKASPEEDEKKQPEKPTPETDIEECKKKLRGIFNRLSEGNIEIMFEQAIKLLSAASSSTEVVAILQQVVLDSFLASAVKPIQVGHASLHENRHWHTCSRCTAHSWSRCQSSWASRSCAASSARSTFIT
ncbi:MAG: hypothetical protein P4L67_00195 [Candidatus Pacebacteria bacterium]|nr:hypothetical protein [Candidatus Paceibacterota bacterium]